MSGHTARGLVLGRSRRTAYFALTRGHGRVTEATGVLNGL